MNTLIQQITNALALGSTYALLAVGLALVFSVMNLVNFAHGELLTVAGYALFFLAALEWPFVAMAIVAVALAALVAVGMDQVAFRPLRGAPGNTLLLTSLAVSVIIQLLFQHFVDPRGRPVAVPALLRGSIDVGSIRIGAMQIAALLIAITSLVAVSWFLTRTMLGTSLRAAAEDFETTRLMGVRANSVIATGLAVSGALAGIAGVLWVSQRTTVDPTMGLTPVLTAFIAVIIGGIGSLNGAVIAAFLLGGLEIMAEAYLPADLQPVRDGLVWVVVILVLMLRPSGLFAREELRV
jgi:branched-chain amino acid transport system permease protein